MTSTASVVGVLTMLSRKAGSRDPAEVRAGLQSILTTTTFSCFPIISDVFFSGCEALPTDGYSNTCL